MFLLVKYFLRPRNPNKTSMKGYWKQEDAGQYDEQLSFSRKLRDKDSQRYNVILDLKNEKIIKCTVGEIAGTDYDTIYRYFRRSYPREMEIVMNELHPPIVTEAAEASPEVAVTESGEVEVKTEA